jgi:hypothetical protein
LTWGTTATDALPYRIEIGANLLGRPRRKAFKALGTIISFEVTAEVELQNRISRAWCAFYKHKFLLTCKALRQKN